MSYYVINKYGVQVKSRDFCQSDKKTLQKNRKP